MVGLRTHAMYKIRVRFRLGSGVIWQSSYQKTNVFANRGMHRMNNTNYIFTKLMQVVLVLNPPVSSRS